MPYQESGLPDVIEQFDVGGVDSRSNALNMPVNRSLRLLNFVPFQGGGARLRYGYAKQTSSAAADLAPGLATKFTGTRNFSRPATATLGAGGGLVDSGVFNLGTLFTPATAPPFTLPIHSELDYFSWDTGAHYALYGQAGLITRYDMQAGTRTKVAQLASAARWNAFKADNRVYIGNGVDMLWYDGLAFRRNGIPALGGVALDKVIVFPGVRELLNSEAVATAVTPSTSGGSLPVSQYGGIQLFASAFDPVAADLGPATSIQGRSVITTPTSSILVGALPNWASLGFNWFTLISATDDGQSSAKFVTLATAGILSIRRTAGVATMVTNSGVGGASSIVSIEGLDDLSFNGVFQMATLSAGNTYTFNQPGLPDTTGVVTSISKAYRVLAVDSGGGTAPLITALNNDQIFLTTSDIGLPATSVVTDTPGYQFYASAYAINAGQHIGNRFPIGKRLTLTHRSTVRIANLPMMNNYDAEWVYLLGRTMDGAKLPYAFIDPAGNFTVAQATQSSAFMRFGTVDFNSELPYRNGVPPGMDKFCRIGDKVYGNGPNSPFIYKSASAALQKTGQLMGVAAQSWDPTDLETMPTAEAVTCLVEYDSQAWVFSKQNLAILDENAGIGNWQGPYPEGCAGQRAFVRTSHGPFWLSGKKQLCTRGEFGPLPISEEYEASLLARIGPAFLSKVELAYLLDPEKGIDHIRISALDKNGVQFQVIHDFKLRDSRSPYGQGYSVVFTGALASPLAMKGIQDVNFSPQIWAGGSDGELYQLETGWSDGGSEFTGDWVVFPYFGPERMSISSIQFQGDLMTQVSWSNRLDKTLADLEDLPMQVRKGNDFLFQANGQIKNTPAQNPYIRFQLTSRSAQALALYPNGPALNDPPHLPLEVYGNIWVVRANPSGGQGAG